MAKIIFTGGSGVLGTEIQKIKKDENILFPSSTEFNVCDLSQCENYIISNNQIDLIIHAAAYTKVKQIEEEDNLNKVIDINIVGTSNIVKLCQKFNIKLVYISTDYVFDGIKGDYCINDYINPLSKYAKSKAAAELVVRMYDNSLVIRTSFFANYFPYDKAFVDQWTTKDYVDKIAPKILKACLSNDFGIKHVYSNKKTIFELAKERKPNVLPITRNDVYNISIPKDTSLI